MDEVLTLTREHAWVALAALLIGAVVRAAKSDRMPLLRRVPARYRPAIVVVLASVSAALEAVLGGVSPADAVWGGVVSGALAVFGHQLGIEMVRDGKEL